MKRSPVIVLVSARRSVSERLPSCLRCLCFCLHAGESLAYPHAFIGLVQLCCHAALHNASDEERVGLVTDLEHILLAHKAKAAVCRLPLHSWPSGGQGRMKHRNICRCSASLGEARTACQPAPYFLSSMLANKPHRTCLQVVQGLPHVTVRSENDGLKTVLHICHLQPASKTGK